MLGHIFRNNSITVMLADGPHTITESHLNYSYVRENFSSLITMSDEEILNLFDVRKAVVLWSENNYAITEDGVFYQNERLPDALERKVLDFWSENLPVTSLLAFHSRVRLNPSARAVNELYKFLEHKNLPLSDRGTFYAYKAIRQDWFDIYSGTIKNTIGAEPTMPRNTVDDNCNAHCSTGLHVGSLDYVKWYGNGYGGGTARVVIVEVDPADVVSVPLDHDCQKVRVCRYKVIAEYTGPLPETTWTPTSYEEELDDDWQDEDDDWNYDEDGCN